ncbi:hypothetical protein GCK72_007726 [Caenorhabditis remanei]|uniref:Uncharacterized protein n=1 Tax=Caenorhabditis remanei TaxID=31234 RepID=A0A6A5HN56_CAERE|nr:hypothetical protein GCK72_007726 [Caenorhabditis remanei]KAF1767767.1 hypothetical protein GCK72_007726 [Caenorhabditis remanei]
MNICDKSIKKNLNSVVLPCIVVLGIVTIGVITSFILAFSLGILQSTGEYSQALFTWLYIYFPIAILCNVAMIIGWYRIRVMLKQDKEQLNNADTSTITSSQ